MARQEPREARRPKARDARRLETPARFLAQGIGAFVPHDLRRAGRTTLGRLGVSPFIGERLMNHSKDVKRDALERLERLPTCPGSSSRQMSANS